MVDQDKHSPPQRQRAPTPTYDGVKIAREIDNFFWGLEAYFEAIGITDKGQKVSHASFSLKDTALVCWRCRCDNVKRGSDRITTWGGFKRELKKQFYPKDAEYEGRAKL